MQQGHVFLDGVEITDPRRGRPHGRPRLPPRRPPDHGEDAARRPAPALLRDARRCDQRPRQALPHQSRDARGRFGPVAGLDDEPPRAPRRQRTRTCRCCSTSPRPRAAPSSSRAPSTGPRSSPSSSTPREFRPSSCTATSARVPARATWTTSTRGRAQTLVATDIAARGIHVDDVALVIHADPPVEHKAYLHRSGRTARAGNDGTVVTMMLDEQVRDVRDLTRKAGIKPTTTRVQLGHPLLDRARPRRAVVCRWPRPRGRSGRARVTARAVAAPVVDAVAAAATAVPPPVAVAPVPVVAAGERWSRSRPRRRRVAAAQGRCAVVAPGRWPWRSGRWRVGVAAVLGRRRRFRPSRRLLDRLLDEQRWQRRVVLRRLAAPAPAAPADPPASFNRREATCGRLATVERPNLVARLGLSTVLDAADTWPFDGWGQERLRERLRPRNSAMI